MTPARESQAPSWALTTPSPRQLEVLIRQPGGPYSTSAERDAPQYPAGVGALPEVPKNKNTLDEELAKLDASLNLLTSDISSFKGTQQQVQPISGEAEQPLKVSSVVMERI